MKLIKKKRIYITAVLAAAVLLPFNPASAAVQNPPSVKPTLQAAAGLQMPFVENRGQVPDPAVAYMADTFAYRVAVTRDGQIIYSLPRNIDNSQPAPEFSEHIANPGKAVKISGSKPQAAKVSYFQGRDPSKWQCSLQSYGRLDFGRVAPGIRVELEAHGNNVEKIFHIQPGADPSVIRLAVEGVKELRVSPKGELVLAGALSSLCFTRPVAYQRIDGRRVNIPVRYTVSQNTYGFTLNAYDTSKALVIDPLIRVFAYRGSGGSTYNAFMDAAADAQGNVYAAGYTRNQLAILKLDRRLEKLQAAAYFSKNGSYVGDNIWAIAVDGQGNVFVAGNTWNENFPVIAGCHKTTPSDKGLLLDGFITKFSADLNTILASTYIGGSDFDEMLAMAIDAKDRVYVAGFSKSNTFDDQQGFPVTPDAYDTVPPPETQKKAVVARLDNNLTMVQAATYLGGSVNGVEEFNKDRASCLVVDSDGNIWVAGHTSLSDFPVTAGCLDPTYNGAVDVFLSKLDADLEHLLISTYIGGSNDEEPTDLLLDGQGNPYLLGFTYSTGNFPMPSGGYDPNHSNYEEDGFILKLDSGGSRILAGTFLNGDYDTSQSNCWGDDRPAAMAFSADYSQLLVVGRTESVKYPVTPGCVGCKLVNYLHAAPDRDEKADKDYGDGFITALSGDLTRLIYSTFIGGPVVEYLDAVLINGDDIIVAGETQSSEFPLAYSEDSSPRAVLMRFNADETPDDSGNNPDGSSTKSSGGGGGGCFVSNCLP